MRRSNLLLNIISVVVLAALVIYFVFSVLTAGQNPLKTTLASYYVKEDSVVTQGFAVRNEEVISGAGNISIIVENGQKLYKGQIVAQKYSSVEALNRVGEINAVKAQIKQLEESLGVTELNRGERTVDSIINMTYSLRSGSMSELQSKIMAVESYAFGTDASGEDTATEIEILQKRLELLMEQDIGDTGAVAAEYSGVYYSVTDGYENITPELLDGITPSAYEGLFSKETTQRENAGKVITGLYWYYVTVVDEASAVKLVPDGTAVVRFSGNYNRTVEMSVEYISDSENGQCAIILSNGHEIADTAGLREMTGEIIFSQQEGIKLPMEAVKLDEDGQTVVYVLTGVKVKVVPVEVLDEVDGYYLVLSGNEAELHEGTEIIVKAKDLYDGKVVT